MPWHQLYISTQKLINSFSLWFIKKMKLKCLNSLTTKKRLSLYEKANFCRDDKTRTCDLTPPRRVR